MTIIMAGSTTAIPTFKISTWIDELTELRSDDPYKGSQVPWCLIWALKRLIAVDNRYDYLQTVSSIVILALYQLQVRIWCFTPAGCEMSPV